MTNEPSRALRPTRSSTPFVPLQLVARIVNGGTPKSDTVNWGGDIPFITPPDLNGLHGDIVESWERTLTKAGVDSGSTLANDAVLLSCRAPIGHVGRVSRPVAFNQGCKALIPERGADTRYLAYCLVAARPALEAMGNGTTFTELSVMALSALRLPWPEAPTRDSMADYLDSETGDIDAMDSELDALIERLRKRKIATISAAWPEPVPDDWEVRPLWSMFRREKILGFVDEPMVSVFRDYGVVFKDDYSNTNVTATDRSIYQLVEPGWLVVNRMKAWQGSVGVSAIRGISSGHYICFRPIHQEDHSYLNLLVRSAQYRDWFAMYSRGVRPSQEEIDNGYLNAMPIVVPPMSEQRRIVAEIDEATSQIDSMIADAQRLKALLAERRTNLITEVVTGRMEVL